MRKIVKKYAIPHEHNDFRPYLLRAAGVVGMLVLIVSLFFGSQVYKLAIRTSDFIASVLPGVLVDLTNADREAFSLGSLAISPLLEEAARLKAEDMAAQSYFAHQSPEGISPWHWFAQAGYRFAYAGENLAIHFDDSVAVNAAWMASPGHQANILSDKFTEIGIATAKGVYEGRETIFVVQMFGRPLPLAAEGEPAPVISIASIQEPREGASVAATEIEVTPLASGESEEKGVAQSFVAVENAENLVADEPRAPQETAGVYASQFDKLVSSPQKLLALAYGIISAILLGVLLSVLLVRHNNKKRHILMVLILLLALAALYYAYKVLTPSGVEIAVLVSN